MAGTVADVARAALAALGSDAGQVLAATWAAERYSEVAATARLKQLRQVGSVVIPATITAGTVTVTQDSDIVTGDATARAAWDQTLVGRFFRTGTVWYEIGGVDGAPSLRLKTVYAETTSASATYAIVQRYADLPRDARHLGDFVHARRRRKLNVMSSGYLHQRAPERQYLAGGPVVVSEVGQQEDGTRRVEIYPYSATPEVIHFLYWQAPPVRWAPEDPLPGALDVFHLKEGVLIDVYRYEAAQAAKAGKLELAAYYRNELRAQETKWERIKPQIVMADSGIDDHTFFWASVDAYPQGEIATARDEFLARGSSLA